MLEGGPPAEWTSLAAWHVDALRAAGYAEGGPGWRHGTHAAVVAAPGTAAGKG